MPIAVTAGARWVSGSFCEGFELLPLPSPLFYWEYRITFAGVSIEPIYRCFNFWGFGHGADLVGKDCQISVFL